MRDAEVLLLRWKELRQFLLRDQRAKSSLDHLCAMRINTVLGEMDLLEKRYPLRLQSSNNPVRYDG